MGIVLVRNYIMAFIFALEQDGKRIFLSLFLSVSIPKILRNIRVIPDHNSLTILNINLIFTSFVSRLLQYIKQRLCKLEQFLIIVKRQFSKFHFQQFLTSL